MKTIDSERVHALLDYPALVAALRDGHLEDIDAMEEVMLDQPSDGGLQCNFNVLPAWQRHKAMGVKIVTSFPENEAKGTGLPTVQGVYLMFDGADGRPTALIDGTALTLRKTAADSALGADFLARQAPERMLMVGAGALCPHLIMAHKAVRPSIKHAAIWNRTPERAALAAAGLDLAGVEVTPTRDIEAAAREADLICCATGATCPLIFGAWLKPGAHLDLIGGFTPSMREADDEAVRRARIYVDSRRFVGRCGDITGPIEAGVMTEGDIVGDLYELCHGEAPGRQSAEEITFFKNGGGGHLDLYTARFLLSRDSAG